MEMNKLTSLYGSYTFNDEVLRERIPNSTYKAFHESLKKGETLSKECATVIANAMKIWAIEKGATHFTHWFSPLNGLSAEKHDAFLEPDGERAILEFSGKLLRKGEPDASSFPSGGLRATFEARGYTAWDCTSNAFVKDGSLYIPTLFCSYTGEALDNKTPLLKSCDILSKEVTKLLNLLGYNDVEDASSYVGSEQEYFLVDENYFNKRLDLRLTGRTLFGAIPPKGQELDDHYFGSINTRVSNFMKELDEELWKFGIPSKTKHNEAAPAQHEIACVYRKVNITTDNNHLLMQLMQDIAKKHHLRCLLHEKPFKGVNGSGKHNNWSIVTNTNNNLFNPGNDPINNIPFLATLACVIKGVDEYSDLLRLTIASLGNDSRLGGNEAPPAIISMFLGDTLNSVIDSIINDKKITNQKKTRFQTGVSVIPDFSKDTTDRNRTSPFAFTGNKFEFRGVGSSQSIANVNTILNAILAIEMNEMSNELLKGRPLKDILKEYFISHKRIIFEGDGYSSRWEEEAKRRGLNNITNTVDATEVLKNEKIRNKLIEIGVFSEIELNSRYDILLDGYTKTLQVEALTSLKMVKNEIYPACIKYLNTVATTFNNVGKYNNFLEKEVIELSNLLSLVQERVSTLEKEVEQAKIIINNKEKAIYYRDNVLTSMTKLREVVDKLETMVDSSCWPIPTYIDLLFGI